MFDHIDIAILTTLNQLAARLGIKPCEFIASLHRGSEMEGHFLIYTIPSETTPAQEVKIRKMFEALSVPEYGSLRASERPAIDILTHAPALLTCAGVTCVP